MIRLPRLPDAVLRTLLDCATEADGSDPDAISAKYFGDPSLDDLWREHSRPLLAAWVEEHPGSRPSYWWRLEAPRQPLGAWPGRWYDGKLERPRERLGGIGTPAHEVFALHPTYDRGIPSAWI